VVKPPGATARQDRPLGSGEWSRWETTTAARADPPGVDRSAFLKQLSLALAAFFDKAFK